MDRGACCRLLSMESQSRTWLSNFTFFHFVDQMVKNLPAMRETWVRSLGAEDPLEKGKATHSSILAWRIPWTEESGGLQSVGLQRVWHNWATKHTHSYFIHFPLMLMFCTIMAQLSKLKVNIGTVIINEMTDFIRILQALQTNFFVCFKINPQPHHT